MPDLFDSRKITLLEQIRAAERELVYRQRVYPHWVEAGKMPDQKARHEEAAMAAIVETLRDLHVKEQAALRQRPAK